MNQTELLNSLKKIRTYKSKRELYELLKKKDGSCPNAFNRKIRILYNWGYLDSKVFPNIDFRGFHLKYKLKKKYCNIEVL